jgi:hypothetical protein
MNKQNMLQRPVLLILILTLAPLFSQCTFAGGKVIKGDGHVVTTTHQVDYFNAIELQGAFSNVSLIPGTELTITMETDENLQDLFRVDTRNKTLVVASDRDIILQPTKMFLTIVYPELNRLDIQGACKISSFEKVVTDVLSLEISGAADLDLEVDVQSLRTQVSGAGNIVLEGAAEKHEIRLSGASSLEASRLITNSTQINLSGAGSATVYASERLDASLSGIGRIVYHGDPGEKNISKSGLGSIASAK